jgi:hypothetical protein
VILRCCEEDWNPSNQKRFISLQGMRDDAGGGGGDEPFPLHIHLSSLVGKEDSCRR